MSEWKKEIAIIHNVDLWYDLKYKNFALRFEVHSTDFGGVANLERYGDDVIAMFEAYHVGRPDQFEGKPVWVEVEPNSASPHVRYLKPCLA